MKVRMEMNKQLITIKLKDKETGIESKPVDIEKVIFNQYDIEFEFGEPEDEDYGILSYKNFLFFRDYYEVIIDVKES